ncbi:MAG: RdgB/HAM1 family non-canonical purine NTP pyrophosphatase [Luteolibacter sp.]
METRPRLIIATRNAHKTAEIRSMIGDRYEVLDVTAFPGLPPVAETGTTFLENARLKALAISQEVEGIVLSDDSGLEVDALGGEPGVWSSSYGGEEGNHARNNERLMREMSDKNQRTARFRCTMVLAEGGRELANFDGSVEGAIIEERRGAGGFGYDPLFVPAGYDQTFSQLGDEVKNQLSHRARALVKVVEWLESRE